jgi:hypothetical protein
VSKPLEKNYTLATNRIYKENRPAPYRRHRKRCPDYMSNISPDPHLYTGFAITYI